MWSSRLLWCSLWKYYIHRRRQVSGRSSRNKLQHCLENIQSPSLRVSAVSRTFVICIVGPISSRACSLDGGKFNRTALSNLTVFDKFMQEFYSSSQERILITNPFIVRARHMAASRRALRLLKHKLCRWQCFVYRCVERCELKNLKLGKMPAFRRHRESSWKIEQCIPSITSQCMYSATFSEK